MAFSGRVSFLRPIAAGSAFPRLSQRENGPSLGVAMRRHRGGPSGVSADSTTFEEAQSPLARDAPDRPIASRGRTTLPNLELTARPAIPTHRFLGFFKKPSPWDSEQPIREELFSVERLEAHARSLAAAQTVESRATRGLPLAGRLDREWRGPLVVLSIDREGDRRWAPDHAGGRVADRQFSFGGKADPPDQH